MKTFSIGDVVTYVGNHGNWTVGDVHIIAEVQRFSGITHYATNRGAWFSKGDFELQAKATEASLAQLDEDLNDEDEGEEL